MGTTRTAASESQQGAGDHLARPRRRCKAMNSRMYSACDERRQFRAEAMQDLENGTGLGERARGIHGGQLAQVR
jgi:hypothetical protein